MADRVLIIGAGHAGGQCAASLRASGWTGEIVLAGAEPLPPYQRPPLSKAYLAGELAEERLYLRPEAFYEKETIELRLGATAAAIDRAAKTVRFEDGSTLGYSKLVLATGTRPRRLAVPGANLSGVGYLRDVADVKALQGRVRPGARLVVVGAGYIGLEVAAVAIKRGLKVTVLEAMDRVLARVTSPVVSAFYEDAHRAAGVDLRLNARLAAFEGGDALEAAVLADGTRIECDFAVVGIGIVPNTEIAADAGLAVADGIVVDDHTRTNDPDIYAIGDCTRHPSAYMGAMVRLECVPNALEQGKTAAADICGKGKSYADVPWFWSDQYDLKLQTVGVCAGRYDAYVVRGDPARRSFAVFYLKNGLLIAIDAVNAPMEFALGKRLIPKGAAPDPAFLADPESDLKTLLV